ncbi:MAG TPA: hypothetical protein VNP97_14395, partial [Microbacterium sp.]|nr:hypothetical protein [Microbacterium sp.]
MSEGGGAASASFDARPLIDPVERTAVRAFAQRLRSSGAVKSPFGSGGAVVTLVVGIFVVIMFGAIFVTTFSVIVSAFATMGDGTGGVFAFGAFFPLIIVGGALALIITFVVRASRGTQEKRYRLDRFAAANGLSFLPTLAAPGLPGMIFGVGSSRSASDLVRGERPRFVEFANYQYTTGSGKNRTTHKWGYVAIKLDVPLPHIVLDATSNNGLFRASNLPATFDKDQRLSLEGDFDQHFSLYCPQGYERDALYLFTPDIMARFIDNAAALDVEIVDDWLFLYGKREFSTLDPATWAWLFSVVAALLDKFAQWARWRDDRLRADAAAAAASTPVGWGQGGTDGVGGFTDDRRGRDAGSTDGIDGLPADTSGGDAASGHPAPAASLPFAAPSGLLRPPPGVAPSGRRLTKRFSWVSFVAIGAVLLFWLITQTGVLGL